MKAISIWQPWASLIVLGLKTIETRGWATSHREELLIHASKRWSHGQLRLQAEFVQRIRHKLGPGHPRNLAFQESLPRGGIIGMVNLVACEPTIDRLTVRPEDEDFLERIFGDFSAGRYGWHFARPCTFSPSIPMRGRQGIWDVQSEEVDAIANFFLRGRNDPTTKGLPA